MRRSGFTFPRWLGVFWCGAAIPLVHGVGPWAISLLAVRHGWSDHHPGAWNWLGLILVLMGLAGAVWGLALHFVEAPRGWQLEMTPPYLLMRGPYRFTRNPIYLAYAPMWIGWMIFYGSIPLVILCAVGGGMVNVTIVRWEERKLEARFGDAYREYKRRVPRWIGRVRP